MKYPIHVLVAALVVTATPVRAVGPVDREAQTPKTPCAATAGARILAPEELRRLFETAFDISGGARELIFLVDIPAGQTPSTVWLERHDLVRDWAAKARTVFPEVRVRVLAYAATGGHNAPMPKTGWEYEPGAALPESVGTIGGAATVVLADQFRDTTVVVAPAQYSPTSPMRTFAKSNRVRGATMPMFLADMIPSLRLDPRVVRHRCDRIKALLDPAETAELEFRVGAETYSLQLDLRHRESLSSWGDMRTPGVVENLPGGETFIVPYEGERAGDASRSRGRLPVQFGDEVVVYEIRENRAVAVLSKGPKSDEERRRLASEPAYGNIAELGFGVLAALGVEPLGLGEASLLLEEKLGLHIAFGLSSHLPGGSVKPTAFSSDRAVVHIDRLYLPQLQSRIHVATVRLLTPGQPAVPVMRDGEYVPGLFDHP